LDFSVRTYNCLKKASVLTIGDLAQLNEGELMQIRNFGKKSLTEVKEKLAVLGLKLTGDTGESTEFGADTDEGDEESVDAALMDEVEADEEAAEPEDAEVAAE
jgi:DNA-directed RNA polymerase subunit alpha